VLAKSASTPDDVGTGERRWSKRCHNAGRPPRWLAAEAVPRGRGLEDHLRPSAGTSRRNPSSPPTSRTPGRVDPGGGTEDRSVRE
jgi:hypothetical protein